MLTKIIKGAARRGLACWRRLAPLIVSLLVFWTGIDSQFFQLIAAESLPPPSRSPLSCPDDSDDDEMINLTSTTTSLLMKYKKDPHSLPQDLHKGNCSGLSSFDLSCLPVPSEDRRTKECGDNFETPLRC
jgi:hypothetical protein